MSVLTIASLIDIGLAADLCVAQSFGGFTPDPQDCANRTFVGYNGTATPSPSGSGGGTSLTPGQIAGIAIAGVVVLVALGLLCNGIWDLCRQSGSSPQGDSGAKPFEAEKQTAGDFTNNTGAPVQEQNQNINLA